MEEQAVKELICEIKHSSIPVPSQAILLELVENHLVNTKLEEGRQCPKCGSYNTKVVDHRYFKKHDKHLRKRKCNACEKRWNTEEVVVEEA